MALVTVAKLLYELLINILRDLGDQHQLSLMSIKVVRALFVQVTIDGLELCEKIYLPRQENGTLVDNGHTQGSASILAKSKAL